MKLYFGFLIICLSSLTSTWALAEELTYQDTTPYYCYYTLDEKSGANIHPMGAVEDEFAEGTNVSNSTACFNLLKWLASPTTEEQIGETGTFTFQSSKDTFRLECRYEILNYLKKEVDELLRQALMFSKNVTDTFEAFNSYEYELDKSVEVRCEFLGS